VEDIDLNFCKNIKISSEQLSSEVISNGAIVTTSVRIFT
jgi:hypothetical protein